MIYNLYKFHYPSSIIRSLILNSFTIGHKNIRTLVSFDFYYILTDNKYI